MRMVEEAALAMPAPKTELPPKAKKEKKEHKSKTEHKSSDKKSGKDKKSKKEKHKKRRRSDDEEDSESGSGERVSPCRALLPPARAALGPLDSAPAV